MTELKSGHELLKELGWGRLNIAQYGTMRRAGFSKDETEAADYDTYQTLRNAGELNRQSTASERQCQFLLSYKIDPEGLSYLKARHLIDHLIEQVEEDSRFVEYLKAEQQERERKAEEKRGRRALQSVSKSVPVSKASVEVTKPSEPVAEVAKPDEDAMQALQRLLAEIRIVETSDKISPLHCKTLCTFLQEKYPEGLTNQDQHRAAGMEAKLYLETAIRSHHGTHN